MKLIVQKGIRFFLFFILCFFFVIIEAQTNSPQECSDPTLYCRILKLKPNIDHQWAKHFAILLAKYGKEYHMDPWRSLAIAMQETSLRDIHRKHTIIIFYEQCQGKKCIAHYRYVDGYSDLTVFQFHTRTIVGYQLDPVKLSNNLDYAVQEHFLLLREKMKQCEDLGAEAWTCYHSKTPIFREQYEKLVDRYYYKPSVKNIMLAKK